MFTVKKMFGWPSVQYFIDGGAGSVNGNSKKAKYGWYRWEQWCVGFDMEAGKVFTYVDGDEDGASTQNADAAFLNPMKRANTKIKEPNLITDVLVGCQLTEDGACK